MRCFTLIQTLIRRHLSKLIYDGVFVYCTALLLTSYCSMNNLRYKRPFKTTCILNKTTKHSYKLPSPSRRTRRDPIPSTTRSSRRSSTRASTTTRRTRKPRWKRNVNWPRMPSGSGYSRTPSPGGPTST